MKRLLAAGFFLMLPSVLLAESLPGMADSAELRLAAVLQAESEGQLLLALSRAQHTFSDNRQHMLARLAYGRLLVKSGDAGRAVDVLQPLVAGAPADWRPWFWLGSARLLRGELEQSADALDQALARQGEQPALWIQRAIVEQERGRPQVAAHYLQVAASLAPDNPDVLFNYAYASEQAGDSARAAVLYRRFLARSAGSPAHGRLRAQALKRLARVASVPTSPARTVTDAVSGQEASVVEVSSAGSDWEDSD